MKDSVEYVARNVGTLDPGDLTNFWERVDDFLEPATLQVGVVGSSFGGASVEVYVITEKSIDTGAADDGDPDGLETLFQTVTGPTVIELPACFGVRVRMINFTEGENVQCLLGGIAYTTHPDGFVQGP
jgi:hypothetical protein